MLSELFVTAIRMDGPAPDDSYLAQLPVVHALQADAGITFQTPVTFVVGENGVGKSTLVEALAVSLGLNAEGGTRSLRFSTNNTHSTLHEHLKVVKGYRRPRDWFFLRAESVYNVATQIDRIGDGLQFAYGGKSLHDQSHGESFLAIAENRFHGNGLYLLDEPEAALSPRSILRLMCTIDRLARQGSQFVISTHSPLLMALPGSTVLQLTDHGIEQVDYRQTEHYLLTRRFLEKPEQVLEELLSNEASG